MASESSITRVHKITRRLHKLTHPNLNFLIEVAHVTAASPAAPVPLSHIPLAQCTARLARRTHQLRTHQPHAVAAFTRLRAISLEDIVRPSLKPENHDGWLEPVSALGRTRTLEARSHS